VSPAFRRPRAGGRLWPKRDYFSELQRSLPEEHPIDVLIERAPAVRKLSRHVLRLRRQVAAQVTDKEQWIRYADARLNLAGLREELAFNMGVELGAVTARAEGLGRKARRTPETAEERAFRRAVRDALIVGAVPAERRLAVLIETAWALAGGAPAPRRARG
jgi:hypothetical protein